MHVVVVTTNQGKFLEIQGVLNRHGITAAHGNVGTKEEGNTLEERCLSKARHAFSLVRKPLMVDDTGLFFAAFENFPGPFPKKVYQELGLEGILKKLEGRSRDALFRSLVCYIDQSGPRLFEGTVHGRIAHTVFDGGHPSLPYDRIFIPEGHEVPFCMLRPEEKDQLSHRARAVEQFARWFVSAATQQSERP